MSLCHARHFVCHIEISIDVSMSFNVKNDAIVAWIALLFKNPYHLTSSIRIQWWLP